jgi:hypothetical protein
MNQLPLKRLVGRSNRLGEAISTYSFQGDTSHYRKRATVLGLGVVCVAGLASVARTDFSDSGEDVVS